MSGDNLGVMLTVIGLLVAVCSLLVPILFQLTKIAKWRGHVEADTEANTKSLASMQEDVKELRRKYSESIRDLYREIGKKADTSTLKELENTLITKLNTIDQNINATSTEITEMKVNVASITGCLSGNNLETLFRKRQK